MLVGAVAAVMIAPSEALAADLVMYMNNTGAAGTYPYSTPATANGQYWTLNNRIAEVNSGTQFSYNYNLTSRTNRITVCFASGTYGSQLQISDSFYTNANYYITLKADAGALPVVTAGASTDCVLVNASYTNVIGISATGSTTSGYSGFKTYYDYVTFDNCHSYGNYYGFYMMGDGTDTADYVSIKNSSAYNNSNMGIYVYARSNYVTIENCSIFRTGSQNYGIYINPDSNGDVNTVTIRGCSIYGNLYGGIYVSSGSASYYLRSGLFERNRIFNNGASYYGIYLGTNPSSSTYPLIIRNNLIYDSTGAAQRYGVYLSSGANYVRMINNTFYNNQYAVYQANANQSFSHMAINNIFSIRNSGSAYGIYMYTDYYYGYKMFGGGCNYNDFYRQGGAGYVAFWYNTGGTGNKYYTDRATWNTDTGYDANSIEVDPQFVDTGGTLKTSFYMRSGGNSYYYMDLSGVTDYVIQSGDYLEYDVLWSQADSYIAFDYTCATGEALRSSGALDQNSKSMFDIGAQALNTWYSRKIAIPVGHVGLTISYYDIASELDSDNVKTAYFRNIRITDGVSTVRKTIYANTPVAYAGHLISIADVAFFETVPDLHLKSTYRHYDEQTSSWLADATTSGCIDAGDPSYNVGFGQYQEPEPHGDRINLGAYGGTWAASKTPTDGAPRGLCIEGFDTRSATQRVYDNAPEFSAVVVEYKTADMVQIEVGTDNNWTAAEMWASGDVNVTNVTQSQRMPDVQYGCQGSASALAVNTVYYWRLRIKYTDVSYSSWAYGYFTTGDSFTVVKLFFDDTSTGSANLFPYSASADACVGISQLSEIIAAVNGDNNGNPSGTGTSNYNLTSTQKSFYATLKNGTYYSKLQISGSFTTSASYYITIQGYDGSNWAYVDGDSAAQGVGHVVNIRANYTQILNLIARDAGANYACFYTNKAFVQFLWCTAYGNGQPASYGVLVDTGAQNVYIAGMNVYNLGTRWSIAASGIYVNGGTSDVLIESCNIYDSGYYQYYGINAYASGGQINNLTIRNNSIHDNYYYGINANGTSQANNIRNLVIAQNAIYNQASGPGINIGAYINESGYPAVIRNNRIYATSPGSQPTGLQLSNLSSYVRIYNNTFYYNGTSIYQQGSDIYYHMCKNNIFYLYDDPNVYAIYSECAFGKQPFAGGGNYNSYYHEGGQQANVGYFGGNVVQALSTWQSWTGYDYQSQENVDPQFVNPGWSGDFHLKSQAGHYNDSTTGWTIDATTSQCIDAGDPAFAYAADAEPSENGNRINMGAYGGTVYASKSLGNYPADTLHCEGGTTRDTLYVYDPTPEFSAIVRHWNTGLVATHAQIQVSADNNWAAPYWDSTRYDMTDKTINTRSVDKSYSGSALAVNTLYFWRIRFFFDVSDTSGSSWAYARFRTGDEFNNYKVYFTNSGGGNRAPYSDASDAANGISNLATYIANLNGDNHGNGGSANYNLVTKTNKFKVYLRNSTFTSVLDLPSSFTTNATYNFTIQAEPGAMPVMRYGSATYDRVTIAANYTKVYGLRAIGAYNSGYCGFRADADYVTFENCIAENCYYGFLAGNSSALDYTTIKNCVAYNNDMCGIYVAGGANSTMIQNCAIYSDNGSQNYGIQLYAFPDAASLHVDNTNIVGNSIYANSSAGIWMVSYNSSYKTYRTLVYGNRIYNNPYGIYAAFGVDSNSLPLIVQNNMFYSTSSSLMQYGLYLQPDTNYIRIINNTFYNIYYYSIYSNYNNWASRSHMCKNNNFYIRNSANAYGIYMTSMSDSYRNFEGGCDYNNFYRAGTNCYVARLNSNLYTARVEWNAGTGYDANSIEVDPLFYDAGGILKASFLMKATAGAYRYEDLSSVTDYTIQSGDYVEYDVYWTTTSDYIVFDYTTNSSQTLRDSGAVDQNGMGVHPATDISSRAYGVWYHRKIAVPVGHVGHIIQNYDIACSINGENFKTAYLDNIRITDGASTTRKDIYSGGAVTHVPHYINYGEVLYLDGIPDLHEKSMGGHYDEPSASFVLDATTSGCVDTGNPADSYANETTPNGGRINMGAYGNTAQASRTYDPTVPDAPTVSSSTHPTQTTWYNNDDPSIQWAAPANTLCGIDGYSYILDGSPSTTPDTTKDCEETTVSAGYTNLSTGTYYFHIRAVSNHLVWGATAHFTIHIDTTPPSTCTAAMYADASKVTPYADGSIHNDSTPYFEFASGDCESGIKGFFYYFGTNAAGVPNTWTTSASASPTCGADGIYYFRLIAQNNASVNSSSVAALAYVYDSTNPAVSGPHIQSISTHSAGTDDGYSPAGGIAAGTTGVYADYTGITETNPDCTAFIIVVTGGGGGGSWVENSADTTTPSPVSFGSLSLNGKSYLICTVAHRDMAGNFSQNSSVAYYVAPYQPSALSVAPISLSNSTLLLSAHKNPSEDDTIRYAVHNIETGMYVASDNTCTAANESAAVWRTETEWANVVIAGLAEDTTYTFRVKSRNPNSTTVYSPWSATASACTGELNPPVISGAHLQSGSVHSAGDGIAAAGGIAAGTTGVYLDYDSITEKYPDCTSFTLTVTGGAGSGQDAIDMTTPAPMNFTGLVLSGASKIDARIGHKDKTGNYAETASGTYFIKPYMPLAPAISVAPNSNSSLLFSIAPHASENATIEYCAFSPDFSMFVAPDNTCTAADESSAAWRTAAGWAGAEITGLMQSTTYSFRVKSRNKYSSSLYSDWSVDGSGLTGEFTPPVVTGAHVQSGAAHDAGNGFNPAGEITAGTAFVYMDYDSIAEQNPDCTSFALDIVGGTGLSVFEDSTPTTAPAPHEFTGLALTGASYMKGTVGHKDKTGNYTESSSVNYYVKPYAPGSPNVVRVPSDNSALFLAVNSHASENGAVEYCAYNFECSAFVALDNTCTASDETSAAWRTMAGWFNCRLTGFVQDTTYTFRVKSRNLYSPLIYSDWGANTTCTTGELNPPVVAGAHIQSGAVHDAGNGYSTAGGIAAGTADVYLDYDSIDEQNPDCTAFILSVVGGSGSAYYEENSATTTPAPHQFTGLTLTGASKIFGTVCHKDKYGNYNENSSATYYVKPYTPDTPVVNRIFADNSGLLFTLTPNPSECAGILYAVYNFEFAKYVASDNTCAAADESAAAWRTFDAWTNCRIAGLAEDATYTFRVKSRNMQSGAVYSDWSANAAARTDELAKPVIANVHLQAGAAHSTGDGLAPLGGIAAGTTNLYLDYDAIAEKYPDCTSFEAVVTDGIGSGSGENDSDTNLPNPFEVAGLVLHGASAIDCKIGHKDKTGNYGETAPGTYYVKPYTPPAPTVLPVNGEDDRLTVDVNVHASECASVEYSVFCVETAEYAHSDGTMSATAEWHTEAGWGVITALDLTTSATYTFRTQSRNPRNTAVLSDWSADSSAKVNNYPPVVGGAHVQGAPAHVNGTDDGFAAAGGIAAGADSVYVDYTIISDEDPDCATFILAVTGSGPAAIYQYENGDDITEPSAAQFNGLALDGADKLSANVTCMDGAFNTTTSSSTEYYVKPYAPDKPIVGRIYGEPNALLVTLRQHSGEDAAVEYAIYSTTLSRYVAADGTPSAMAENSAAWKTAAQWGTAVVTGLLCDTTYSFRVKSRNLHLATLYSDWSVSTDSSTPSAPSAPDPCYCDGMVNPETLSNLAPQFSATHNDNGDTTAVGYEIEVGIDGDWTNAEMWNPPAAAFAPPVASGGNSSLILYAGSPLVYGSTYYWRIRVINSIGILSPWSATQYFSIRDLAEGAPAVYISLVSPTEVGAGQFSTVMWTSSINGSYTIEVGGDGTWGSGIEIAKDKVSSVKTYTTIINESKLPDNRPSKIFIIVRDRFDNEGFASFVLTDDQTPPIAVIDVPANGSILRTLEGIAGTAADPVGVLFKVQVSIRDVTAGKFYRAGSFDSDYEQFLDVAGLTDWSFNSSGIFTSDGRTYAVKAMVTDTVGLTGNATAIFSIDSRVPNVVILDPSRRYIGPGGSIQIDWYSDLDSAYWLVLGGTGTGPSTGMVLENGACTAGTIVASMVNASSLYANEVGRLFLYAEHASSGAYGTSSVEAVYDTLPPVCAIESPANGSTIVVTLPVVVGTAHDNLSGVSYVEFSIKLGTLFYNGSGYTSTPFYYAATGSDVWTYMSGISFPQPGIYVINAFAADKCGNRQAGQGTIGMFKVAMTPPKKKKHGGCFIATCSLSSSNGAIVESDVLNTYRFTRSALADVENLRAFRDRVLNVSMLGRQVRNSYYAVGPVAATAASEYPAARFFVRWTLVKPLAAVYYGMEYGYIWIIASALAFGFIFVYIIRRNSARKSVK